jgi:hypothetical protein
LIFCQPRLQYLVQKGAILRKGQRIKTKFCKFSSSSEGAYPPCQPSIQPTNANSRTDRLFIAVLYTSESNTIMRYTDEGETTELCKWSVDLSALPSFQRNASNPHNTGFYTGAKPSFIPIAPDLLESRFLLDFELGLELDSAEVRGVLLHNNEEWGRYVVASIPRQKCHANSAMTVSQGCF